MANVHDVAAYVLAKRGRMTTWKLQKLVYYCQAWNVVWDEEPLFPEPIEAWANGPVVPALYAKHRKLFEVSEWPHGDTATLTAAERDTVEAVLTTYGRHAGRWLIALTHQEPPWRDARKGLSAGERGDRKIEIGALNDYYGSL
jgi:uncharacterized phage-associated protein